MSRLTRITVSHCCILGQYVDSLRFELRFEVEVENRESEMEEKSLDQDELIVYNTG
jgi:hypothetical protein